MGKGGGEGVAQATDLTSGRRHGGGRQHGVADGPGDTVPRSIQQRVEGQRVGSTRSPPSAGCQREQRVTVEHRVHRPDRPSHPVVADPRDLRALRLGQRGVGRNDPDRRREPGPEPQPRPGGGSPLPRRSQISLGHRPQRREFAGKPEAGGIQLAGQWVDAGADGVDDDQRGDRRPVRQDRRRRPDSTLETPGSGARARPDAPLLDQFIFAEWFQRLAQTTDVYIDGALLDVDISAPDVIEQLSARINSICMSDEKIQQPILSRADRDRLIVNENAVCQPVDAQTAEFDEAIFAIRQSLPLCRHDSNN